MKRSIAAVIVTYNRKKLLHENIKMLKKQSYKLDKIIIIDNNGKDDTLKYLTENENDFSKIEYIYLNENIGGAGGFYTGVKLAYEQGYDWILLMDDDGRPYDIKTIENLMEAVENFNLDKKAFMINSLVLCNESKLSFGIKGMYNLDQILLEQDNNIIKNYINPFNGTLISRELIKDIGFPNKEFFIKGDEVDFTRRALKSNAFVATIVNSKYYHPSVKGIKIHKILGKNMLVYIEAPWKEFYTTRNHTYSLIRDVGKREARIFLFKRLYCTLMCKCKKYQTIKMILKGYYDAKKGRLGATIKP